MNIVISRIDLEKERMSIIGQKNKKFLEILNSELIKQINEKPWCNTLIFNYRDFIEETNINHNEITIYLKNIGYFDVIT